GIPIYISTRRPTVRPFPPTIAARVQFRRSSVRPRDSGRTVVAPFLPILHLSGVTLPAAHAAVLRIPAACELVPAVWYSFRSIPPAVFAIHPLTLAIVSAVAPSAWSQ